jgi:hypothetical protein
MLRPVLQFLGLAKGRGAGVTRPNDRFRNRARLRVEALEERCTPTSFTVNTLDDTSDANVGDGIARDAAGNTSLRAAIQELNRQPAGIQHVIDIVNLTGTIVLNSALPELERDIYINNNTGAAGLTVQAGGAFRIFTVNPGTNCTIGALTLNNGRALGAGAAGRGGAILNYGNLIVSACNIYANGAQEGGGIYNAADGDPTTSCELHLIDTVMANNWAVSGDGGAIFNEQYAELMTNCTLTGNTAHAKGGAIANIGGEVDIAFSTIENNIALTGHGGGIYNESQLAMQESTLSNNRCDATGMKGGGLYNRGTANLLLCTIRDNQATHGSGVWWVVGSSFVMDQCNIINNDVNSGAP